MLRVQILKADARPVTQTRVCILFQGSNETLARKNTFFAYRFYFHVAFFEGYSGFTCQN